MNLSGLTRPKQVNKSGKSENQKGLSEDDFIYLFFISFYFHAFYIYIYLYSILYEFFEKQIQKNLVDLSK